MPATKEENVPYLTNYDSMDVSLRNSELVMDREVLGTSAACWDARTETEMN